MLLVFYIAFLRNQEAELKKSYEDEIMCIYIYIRYFYEGFFSINIKIQILEIRFRLRVKEMERMIMKVTMMK